MHIHKDAPYRTDQLCSGRYTSAIAVCLLALAALGKSFVRSQISRAAATSETKDLQSDSYFLFFAIMHLSNLKNYKRVHSQTSSRFVL